MSSIISLWKETTHAASLPLIKEVMPSLFTKILSSSSFPVNSSATTYKSARNFLAVSSMYCKKHSQKSHKKGKGRYKKGQVSKLGKDWTIGKCHAARTIRKPKVRNKKVVTQKRTHKHKENQESA